VSCAGVSVLVGMGRGTASLGQDRGSLGHSFRAKFVSAEVSEMKDRKE